MRNIWPIGKDHNCYKSTLMQCMYLCCFHLDLLSIRTLPSHVEHPRNSAAKGLFPCRSGTKINLWMLSKTFSPTESANKSSPCWTRNLYRFYTARVVIATERFLDVKDPSESINQKKRVANGREVGLLSWIPCLTFEIHLWLLSCEKNDESPWQNGIGVDF